MIKATAAVQYEVGEVPQLKEVTLNSPSEDEIVVKVVATGICHTDYSVPGILTELPLIPGHEGAGVIESVGAAVEGLQAGDHVLMSFGSCGACARCDDGHPHDCHSFQQMNFGCTRADGEPGAQADGEKIFSALFGQSSFSTYVVTRARNLVKIGPELPLDLYSPLGCGFMTGAGAVMNELRPEKNSSIVIFGAGPVGLAATMAAAIEGCNPIIVVDLNDDRLELAQELGATHTVNPAIDLPVDRVHEITNGGADYSVETAGVVATFTAAIDALHSGGTCGMLTIPNAGEPFMYSPLQILFGKTLKGIIEGGSTPQDFIPKLIELHQQGKFPLEKLITFYDFEQLEEAMRASKSGEVIKAVLRMKG
ncbi:MAG: NAD(P)-dependent alcohol dehydrogenase [Halioglobus sp.]